MTIAETHLTPTTAASPFLPGTHIQFAWDSTSLGLLKTCPRLYQYIMIEGWGEKDESIHLYFGREYHQAMQDYEVLRAAGADHDFAVSEVVRALLTRTEGWDPDRDTRAGKYKNRHSLVRSVVWYFEHFHDDAAKTLILQNDKAAVELSFQFPLDWGPEASAPLTFFEASSEDATLRPVTTASGQPYLLCGHLDRVVEFSGGLFVMDYKTTLSTPGPYFFDSFQPNNQMTLYTLAGQVVLDSPIKGVIINAIQLLLKPEGYGETRFVRGFTYRTKDNIEEWIADLHVWLKLAEAYAEAQHWPQNDTACDKFGGCKFREICSKSPGARPAFLKSNFHKKEEDEKWNPLRAR